MTWFSLKDLCWHLEAEKYTYKCFTIDKCIRIKEKKRDSCSNIYIYLLSNILRKGIIWWHYLSITKHSPKTIKFSIHYCNFFLINQARINMLFIFLNTCYTDNGALYHSYFDNFCPQKLYKSVSVNLDLTSFLCKLKHFCKFNLIKMQHVFSIFILH